MSAGSGGAPGAGGGASETGAAGAGTGTGETGAGWGATPAEFVGMTGAGGAMVFVAGATLGGLPDGGGMEGTLVCAADTRGNAMSKDNEKTFLRFIKFS
jgi:hypothetical protein